VSNWLSKRGGIAVILIVVTLGLISLGTKLPAFSGVLTSGTPKPRPRAIIQNHIKSCKQTIENNHRLIEAPGDLPSSARLHLPESHRLPAPAFSISVKICNGCTGNISRAPPLPA
jgi:hypothetical protein